MSAPDEALPPDEIKKIWNQNPESFAGWVDAELGPPFDPDELDLGARNWEVLAGMATIKDIIRERDVEELKIWTEGDEILTDYA